MTEISTTLDIKARIKERDRKKFFPRNFPENFVIAFDLHKLNTRLKYTLLKNQNGDKTLKFQGGGGGEEATHPVDNIRRYVHC